MFFSLIVLTAGFVFLNQNPKFFESQTPTFSKINQLIESDNFNAAKIQIEEKLKQYPNNEDLYKLQNKNITEENNFLTQQIAALLKNRNINKSLLSITYEDSIAQKSLFSSKNYLLNQFEELKENPKFTSTEVLNPHYIQLQSLTNYYAAQQSFKEGKTKEALKYLNHPQNKQDVALIQLTNKINNYIANNLLQVQMIDTPPTTNSCKSDNKTKQINCIENQVTNYLNINANKNIAKSLNLASKQSIEYFFEVNPNAKIQNIVIKAPHPILANDLENVLSTFQFSKPARNNNQKITALFSGTTTINYTITPENKPQIVQNAPLETQEPELPIESIKPPRDYVSIEMADQPPTFPGCSGSGNILRKCTTQKINQHIQQGISNSDLNKANPPIGQHQIDIFFKINKYGKVNSIEIQSPYNEIQNTLKQIIKTLPSMQPAIFDNYQVGIDYNVSINFKVY